MKNGASLRPARPLWTRKRLSVGTICERSSMPDVSWCVLEHPSGCFPMTCRRGKRFTSKVPLAGRGLFLSDGV